MKERWAGVSPLGFMLRGGAAVLPCDFENYVSILDADLQNLAVFTFSGIKNLTVLYCSQVSVFFVSRYIRVLEIRLIVKLKKKKTHIQSKSLSPRLTLTPISVIFTHNEPPCTWTANNMTSLGSNDRNVRAQLGGFLFFTFSAMKLL